MRYIYIICLLMSSFFTYKNSFATEAALKYAFFVPQNVFQENVKVGDNINSMKPRYEKKAPPKETLSNNSGLVKSAEPAKISLPYVKKEFVMEHPIKDMGAADKNKDAIKQPAPTESLPLVKKEPPVAPEAPELSEDMKQKLSKYTLGDAFSEETNDSPKQVVVYKDELKKEINKLLSVIPYTNRNLPKFQQCYTDYGSDLRIFFHRGKFPNNLKQEDVLAKVNTSKRFEVK